MNLVEQTASDQEAQSPLIRHGDLQRQLDDKVSWLFITAITGWLAAGLLAIALLCLHGCQEQHATIPVSAGQLDCGSAHPVISPVNNRNGVRVDSRPSRPGVQDMLPAIGTQESVGNASGCNRPPRTFSPSPSIVPARTPVSLGAMGLGSFVSGGVESRHAANWRAVPPDETLGVSLKVWAPTRLQTGRLNGSHSRSSARPAHVLSVDSAVKPQGSAEASSADEARTADSLQESTGPGREPGRNLPSPSLPLVEVQAPPISGAGSAS